MINLNDLTKGLPAISPSWGAALAEAGGVCLESQNHKKGTCIKIRGLTSKEYSLKWPKISDQIRRSWNV